MKRLALALLLIAGRALALNTTTIDSVRAFPTDHNIGIKVYYSGADDDSNAVVSGAIGVENADGSSASQIDTLRFFRSDKMGAQSSAWNGVAGTAGDSKRYYAASAMMCGSDTTYWIWVTVTDADGCTSCPVDLGKYGPTLRVRTNKARTTKYLASLPVGRQVWMGPYGDDANSGADRLHPKATFEGAKALITSPGDQIRLLPGTYYTMRTDSLYIAPDSKNGSPSMYCGVIGDGGETISSADTTSLNGNLWGTKLVSSGVLASVFRYGTAIWPREIVVDDSLRLYPYLTFYKFITDPLHIVSRFGTFWVSTNGDSVFVRMPGDASIAGHRVGVPRKECAMKLESKYWRVDSLTFRDFGSSFAYDVALSPAVINLSNTGNVVERCRFMDVGRPAVGIRIFYDGTEFLTHKNVIQNNVFIQHTLGTPWDGVGNMVSYNELAGTGCPNPSAPVDSTCGESNIEYPHITVEVGRGHVVRWNSASGGADAFVRTTSTVSDTSSQAINDLDVYQNDVINNGGDVIEPDAAPCVNCRVYKNTILGGNTAMNWYVTRGPFYFCWNTCINQKGAFLPRGNADNDQGRMRGHMIIANNTVASNRADGTYAWAQAQNQAQNNYVNIMLVNNFLNNATTVYEGGVLQKNEFNWNVHYPNLGYPFAVTNYSNPYNVSAISDYRDSTYGYGKNDQQAFSISFGDSAHFDWSPTDTWTTMLGPTSARSLPGVNTNMKNHVSPGWRFFARTGTTSDSTFVGAWKVNGMPLERAGPGCCGACSP